MEKEKSLIGMTGIYISFKGEYLYFVDLALAPPPPSILEMMIY
jgi:hypothetical protein